MFKIKIEIFHEGRLVDAWEQEESRISILLKAALKWLNEIGPY